MKNIILYCRVSTDEQAEGCSLDIQEQRLKAYCKNHDYNVIGVYKEDYSAKHFDMKRPEMKKIYEYCRKHKGEVDAILFLRWDRFSRNLEFALTYKRKFYDELGIEINAIESPIDFKGTEWAMMFAMYCGVAHTEDEKISKRTKDGIHGTLLKGKCPNKAPIGYKNVRVAKHDCWVEIDEDKADKVKALFREVAKGVETPNCIRRRIMPKLATSTFFNLLRNRFFVGDVFVPAYGDDEAKYVKGIHEPLIDRATFDAVQDVLDGKRKKQPKLSKPINPNLYLRKFLVCPVCGHVLTGATSKGNGGHYTYYFCGGDHKHLNKRAEDVNKGFVDYTSKLKPNKAVLALYNEILNDVRGDAIKENQKQADNLELELNNINSRIDRVNDLYFDGEISKAEKTRNIERYEADKTRLENQIKALRLNEEMKIKDKLDYSFNIIGNLGEFFRSAPTDVKIMLLGSIFPEKIQFDGNNYRTDHYNKMLDIIFQGTNTLRGNKKLESSSNEEDSNSVPPLGIEPKSSEPESEILSIRLQGHHSCGFTQSDYKNNK